jgi:hypothetical protein
MAGAEQVEGADQVDVDHRLEGVGAHAQGQGREIARLSGDQDVKLAEFGFRRRHRRGHSVVVPHVGG